MKGTNGIKSGNAAVDGKVLYANRRYKDTIFRMLFSDKKNLLELYNAVSGKNYDNADDLQIVTLENAVYMGMKNDLAFLLNTGIYLYEHQSTVNPNMPLRDCFISQLSTAGLWRRSRCIHRQYRRCLRRIS